MVHRKFSVYLMLLLVVLFAVDNRGLLSRRWIHLYFVHTLAHVPDTTRYALFFIDVKNEEIPDKKSSGVKVC